MGEKCKLEGGRVDWKLELVFLGIQRLTVTGGDRLWQNFVHVPGLYGIFPGPGQVADRGKLPADSEKYMGNPVSSMELVGWFMQIAIAE
jgi:hypothetical protein